MKNIRKIIKPLMLIIILISVQIGVIAYFTAKERWKEMYEMYDSSYPQYEKNLMMSNLYHNIAYLLLERGFEKDDFVIQKLISYAKISSKPILENIPKSDCEYWATWLSLKPYLWKDIENEKISSGEVFEIAENLANCKTKSAYFDLFIKNNMDEIITQYAISGINYNNKVSSAIRYSEICRNNFFDINKYIKDSCLYGKFQSSIITINYNCLYVYKFKFEVLKEKNIKNEKYACFFWKNFVDSFHYIKENKCKKDKRLNDDKINDTRQKIESQSINSIYPECNQISIEQIREEIFIRGQSR
jgi:hypothetical protein